MNEFTKDELEYIYFCVDIVTYKNDEFDENEFTINKIQFLIDNYCEHESGWIDINDRLPDKDHVIAYCQSYPANFVSMVRFEQRHSGELKLLDMAIKDNLETSKEGAIKLIDQIYNQQSEELKVIE